MAVQSLNLIKEEKYVSKKLGLSSTGRHRPGEGPASSHAGTGCKPALGAAVGRRQVGPGHLQALLSPHSLLCMSEAPGA